ncbi:unnamed protein product, partial [Pylaiella littoralis]
MDPKAPNAHSRNPTAIVEGAGGGILPHLAASAADASVDPFVLSYRAPAAAEPALTGVSRTTSSTRGTCSVSPQTLAQAQAFHASGVRRNEPQAGWRSRNFLAAAGVGAGQATT